MKATATWIRDDRLELETQGRKFVTSQDRDEGPSCDPSPLNYFFASVAGCVGYFVSQFLLRHGNDCTGLRVEVRGEMAEKPHRVGALQVDVFLPAGLPEKMKDGAKAAAQGCTVHHTLQQSPRTEFVYH